MDENGKLKDLKGTDTLQNVLSENFDNFQRVVQDIFCELAKDYITEEVQSVIRQIMFRIELQDRKKFEEKIILGKEPEDDDICKRKKLQNIISFSNQEVKIENCSLGYNCELSVIYKKNITGKKEIIAKPIAMTILDMMEKALTNLAALLGEKYDDKDGWQDFKRKIQSMDFMKVYKKNLEEIYSFHKLNELEKICFEGYEKREIAGTLCMIDIEKYTEEEICTFKTSISPKESWEIPCIRKMIEASSGENSCLLVDKNKLTLTGIAVSDMAQRIMTESWKICFVGKGKWSMYDQDVQLLYYENGKYIINQKKVEDNIKHHVDTIKLIPEDKKKIFYEIFKALNELQHGALMIISSSAQESAKRLCSKYNRGTEVFIKLENAGKIDLLKKIADVDGAVIIGPDAICYGFGVILDGEARVKGERGRGARYNSACNYIAGKDEYAVIVSEDKERGMETKYGL